MKPSQSLNKFALYLAGLLVAAGMSGCMNLPGIVSEAEMNAPLKPSFSSPELRTPSTPRPQAMLYGQWEAMQVMDMKTTIPSIKYANTTTSASNTSYTFFDDGNCQMIVKAGETQSMSSGNWTYKNDILTMNLTDATGKSVQMQFKLLWYSDSQFEMRYADLGAYEKLLKIGNAKSVNCSYDERGCMTTKMVISSGSNSNNTTILESPLIFDRKQ